MEQETNNILLVDNDGNEIEFEYIDSVEYGGNEYVVLVQLDDDSDDTEAVILRVEKGEDDKESYVGIDDENELNAVFALFLKQQEQYEEEE